MTHGTTGRLSLSRTGRRAVISSLMALLLMVIGGVPQGSAEIEWCRVDPVISVNGRTYNIIVSSPNTILDSATGPTDVVVTVPNGSSYELIATDAGFGFGETVTFVERPSRSIRDGADAIGIAVQVPAQTRLAVMVEVFEADQIVVSASGRTNHAILLTVRT